MFTNIMLATAPILGAAVTIFLILLAIYAVESIFKFNTKLPYGRISLLVVAMTIMISLYLIATSPLTRPVTEIHHKASELTIFHRESMVSHEKPVLIDKSFKSEDVDVSPTYDINSLSESNTGK